MSFFQVNNQCNGCLACVQNCPANALKFEDDGGRRTLFHSMARCARCGNCWRICPQQAIEFRDLLRGPWDRVAEMELIHCTVCGEPLYTPGFEATLNERLNHRVTPLCPRHRQTLPLEAWKHLASNREDASLGETR